MNDTSIDRYAVVGYPIQHSWSPFIHGLFAKQTGQRMAHVAVDIAAKQHVITDFGCQRFQRHIARFTQLLIIGCIAVAPKPDQRHNRQAQAGKLVIQRVKGADSNDWNTKRKRQAFSRAHPDAQAAPTAWPKRNRYGRNRLPFAVQVRQQHVQLRHELRGMIPRAVPATFGQQHTIVVTCQAALVG